MDKKWKESQDSERIRPALIERAVVSFLEQNHVGKTEGEDKCVAVKDEIYRRSCADFKIGKTYVEVKIVQAGLKMASIGNAWITSLCGEFCQNVRLKKNLLKEGGAKHALLLVFQEKLEEEMKAVFCNEMKKHMKMEGGGEAEFWIAEMEEKKDGTNRISFEVMTDRTHTG